MQQGYDGANRTQLKHVLQEYGLSPHKKLGQNFLCDAQMCDAIVRAAKPLEKHHVMEIGPGAGALTLRLLNVADQVTAIELDGGLCRLLRDKIQAPNFSLIEGDALKVPFPQAQGPMAVVANLPYYITSPLLMRLLQELPQANTLVLMMQKEVAQRLGAQPGHKAYGSLSLAVQYYATARTVLSVPPACFFPQPEVDSSVVLLQRKPALLQGAEEKAFFALVRASFAMRRKTMLNNLSALPELDKQAVRSLLERANVDPGARAEQLSLAQFADLARASVWQKN